MPEQTDHSASRNSDALQEEAPHLIANDNSATRRGAALAILENVDRALEGAVTPATTDRLAEIRQLARWLHADAETAGVADAAQAVLDRFRQTIDRGEAGGEELDQLEDALAARQGVRA